MTRGGHLVWGTRAAELPYTLSSFALIPSLTDMKTLKVDFCWGNKATRCWTLIQRHRKLTTQCPLATYPVCPRPRPARIR